MWVDVCFIIKSKGRKFWPSSWLWWCEQQYFSGCPQGGQGGGAASGLINRSLRLFVVQHLPQCQQHNKLNYTFLILRYSQTCISNKICSFYRTNVFSTSDYTASFLFKSIVGLYSRRNSDLSGPGSIPGRVTNITRSDNLKTRLVFLRRGWMEGSEILVKSVDLEGSGMQWG